MIRVEFIYTLMGVLMASVAIVNVRDRGNPRRWVNAAFWGTYAVTLLAGPHLPDVANGVLVLVMVAVAGTGKMGPPIGDSTTPAEREASARRWGSRLFIPALAIPLLTIVGTFVFKGLSIDGKAVVDPKDVTLISLGIGTIGALVIGLAMLRPKPTVPIVEARRLLDTVGWAAVLPQTLAALGAVFLASGVGKIVATVATKYLPLDTPVAAVITYGVGMALLTALMGNAFAAFPVMTAGIGLPLVIQQFGGNVAAVAAIGMLCGFCGTLTTPMAANFNIVPARLLALPDNAVIRVQIPTALMLLVANIAIMYLFAMR